MHNLRTKTRPADGEPNREYAPDEKTKFSLDFPVPVGKWIGYKGITINEGSGKVRCEMHLDNAGIDANCNFDPRKAELETMVQYFGRRRKIWI